MHSANRAAPEALDGLAAVAATEGRTEKAAMLAGATERLRETFAARALPVESRILGQRIDAAAATVPPEDWATAWGRGRGHTLQEAVTIALDRD